MQREESCAHKHRRVLCVTEYYPPHWTGLAKSVYCLAHNIASRGHSITILTTLFDSNSKKEEYDGSIHIRRIPYQFRVSRTHYSVLIIFKFVAMLRDMDTVIVNSPNSNIIFYALLAKFFRKKLILFHQADIVMPKHTGNRLVNSFIERMFDACTIPAVLLADGVSTFTRDYAEHSRVLRYGVNKFMPYIPRIRLAKSRPTKSIAGKLRNLKKTHVLIGISGRFVEEKGYDILFQAIPKILASFPNAHIVFAGAKEIEYEPFYSKHRTLFDSFTSRTTYLGLLHNGDLSHFYEALNVFVISSRSECFALTQIEAWQKGVPIVVTDVPGARQFVKSSGFGLIVKPEDPSSLADGIVSVLKNRNRFASRHNVAEKYLTERENFPLDYDQNY